MISISHIDGCRLVAGVVDRHAINHCAVNSPNVSIPINRQTNPLLGFPISAGVDEKIGHSDFIGADEFDCRNSIDAVNRGVTKIHDTCLNFHDRASHDFNYSREPARYLCTCHITTGNLVSVSLPRFQMCCGDA